MELLIMKLSLFALILVRWISVLLKLLAGKYLGFIRYAVLHRFSSIGRFDNFGAKCSQVDPWWIQRRSTSMTYSVPFCC